jgi:pilus assembly protein CpaC
MSLTVPDIADALVTNPQQILIHGKAPGTISLFVWEKTGTIKTYEVTVRRDLSVLSNQFRTLFPGEPIAVTGSGKDVVLSGRVSTPYVVEKAAEVAVAYAEKAENVVNLLKLQEGVASNQVMLRVRFAEVSRSALQELGSSFFTGGSGFHDYVARMSTQQFAAPTVEGSRLSIQGEDKWGGGRDTVVATEGNNTFSDFLNFFLFNNRYNVGTVIKALQGKGVFQSLAEPNLVASDGREASFLAGGEFPYPVVQAGAGGNAVTIMFKEFGVRLSFTPTILGGDLIHIKLRPEVSALDFNNAVVIEGFRVPALTTRRTETEVELRDGQTFAVAGLLNNTATSQMRKVPGIGDIPILGLLFRSRAYQKDSTELVVMITPYILKRGSSGVSEGLPNLVEPFLAQPDKALSPPAPYTGSPRYGATETGPTAATPPPNPAMPGAVAPAPANAAAPQGATPSADPRGMVLPKVEPAAQTSAAPAAAVQPAAAPVEPKLSKAELKRIEQARKREQKAREQEAKRQAEAMAAAERAAAEQKRRDEAAAAEQRKRDEAAAKLALQQAEQEKARLEAAAREQAKKDAEAARKAAADKQKAEEQERKLAAEEAEREKKLAEAEAKLKEAQSAYEAVVRNGSAPQPLGVPPQGQKKPNDPIKPQP